MGRGAPNLAPPSANSAGAGAWGAARSNSLVGETKITMGSGLGMIDGPSMEADKDMELESETSRPLSRTSSVSCNEWLLDGRAPIALPLSVQPPRTGSRSASRTTSRLSSRAPSRASLTRVDEDAEAKAEAESSAPPLIKAEKPPAGTFEAVDGVGTSSDLAELPTDLPPDLPPATQQSRSSSRAESRGASVKMTECAGQLFPTHSAAAQLLGSDEEAPLLFLQLPLRFPQRKPEKPDPPPPAAAKGKGTEAKGKGKVASQGRGRGAHSSPWLRGDEYVKALRGDGCTPAALGNAAAPGGGKAAEAKADQTDGNKACALGDLPPGDLGEMLVHKSGKVSLQIGNFRMHVDPGTPCSFAQELAALKLPPQGSTDGVQLLRLGPVHERLLVTPDIARLLSQAACDPPKPK